MGVHSVQQARAQLACSRAAYSSLRASRFLAIAIARCLGGFLRPVVRWACLGAVAFLCSSGCLPRVLLGSAADPRNISPKRGHLGYETRGFAPHWAGTRLIVGTWRGWGLWGLGLMGLHAVCPWIRFHLRLYCETFVPWIYFSVWVR